MCWWCILSTEGYRRPAIARLLGINEHTVGRWMAAAELDRDLDDPRRYYPRPVARPAKLEPSKTLITNEELLSFAADWGFQMMLSM